MSLPSRAIFTNKDGERISSQSVNIGYYVEPYQLAYLLIHEIKDEGFLDTDYVEAYGIKVNIQLLRSVKGVDELEKILEAKHFKPQD